MEGEAASGLPVSFKKQPCLAQAGRAVATYSAPKVGPPCMTLPANLDGNSVGII